MRAKVLARDHHTCKFCGEQADTVDHLLPKVRGGTDHEVNLVAACGRCNATKGAA